MRLLSHLQVPRMVFLTLALTWGGLAWAQLDAVPTDQIQVVPANGGLLSLSWSDTEDALHATLSPGPLEEGKPFTVTLRLDPLTGPAYDVPMVLTLRPRGEHDGERHLVKRTKAGWRAQFTPPAEGPYWLDVSFRTTRYKVLHAGLTVHPAGVPRWAWPVFLAVVLGIGASFWRARRQEVRASSGSAQ